MHHHHGFSLIELLIILAIIAVLASFTYPSYIKQVQKTKRLEAKTALYIVAQQQEEYFLQNSSYAANLALLRNTIQSPSLVQENSKLSYQLSMSLSNSCNSTKTQPCTEYTVTATAQNSQSTDDECKTMTLNHLGEQQPLSCW